jgi:hypothetical protein
MLGFGSMSRRAQRFVVWLPVRVEELAEGMAVTHDVSGRGVMMVTASVLEVGSPVTIALSLPPDGKRDKTVHGRVVRVEPNRDDPEGLWRHRLAVELDEPAPELEAALAELAERGIARLPK